MALGKCLHISENLGWSITPSGRCGREDFSTLELFPAINHLQIDKAISDIARGIFIVALAK
jgi:hypothetical protein